MNRDVYAGIDVGGTRVKMGLVTGAGERLAQEIFEVGGITTYDDFVAILVERLTQLENNSGTTGIALGIGCPGRIDHGRGRVAWLEGKLEYLAGQSLANDFAQRLGRSVYCDNDVNAILLGEAMFGAGKSFSNLVGFTLGTGIGGAVMVEGKLCRGSHHAGGHFGFMSHHVRGGLPHVSGNPGAIENHASHTGLLERIRDALAAGRKSMLTQAGNDMGVKEIFEAADRGDALAGELIDEMQEEVALLAANLIFALDPDAVLIGGGFTRRGGSFVRDIEARVKARVRFLPAEAIRVLPMALGDHAGIFGGAALAMTSAGEGAET